jgi:hypothetical protein
MPPFYDAPWFSHPSWVIWITAMPLMRRVAPAIDSGNERTAPFFFGEALKFIQLSAK